MRGILPIMLFVFAGSHSLAAGDVVASKSHDSYFTGAVETVDPSQCEVALNALMSSSNRKVMFGKDSLVLLDEAKGSARVYSSIKGNSKAWEVTTGHCNTVEPKPTLHGWHAVDEVQSIIKASPDQILNPAATGSAQMKNSNKALAIKTCGARFNFDFAAGIR